MTIYLKKNTSNYVCFTLNERIKLGTPNLILQIRSKEDRSSKLMWLIGDIFYNTRRFNYYWIEEVPKVDEDLENMKVNLKIGSYDYYVWETYSDDLSLDITKNLVESGILRVEN